MARARRLPFRRGYHSAVAGRTFFVATLMAIALPMWAAQFGSFRSPSYPHAQYDDRWVFSRPHQFLDDGPYDRLPSNDTPSDPYEVEVIVKDDDSGEGKTQKTLTVENVGPEVTFTVNGP